MNSVRRNNVLPAIGMIVLAGCSLGESTSRPAGSGTSADRAASPAPRSYVLAAGARIDAVTTEAISSREARVGDVFTAQVLADVRNAGGQVVIPAGSMVLGSVADVSPAPNTRSTGTMTLAISSITVLGRVHPVRVSIDSLLTVNEGRGVETVDMARVAGGAAAGAILGQVIGGNTTGTVIGGVVGGAAGAAMSVMMKDMDIVLPAGARLMLTLRDRLTVMVE